MTARQLDGYGRCTGCGTDFSACVDAYVCLAGCEQPDAAPWDRLYMRLCAAEAVGIARKRELSPRLDRILGYLHSRRRRLIWLIEAKQGCGYRLVIGEIPKWAPKIPETTTECTLRESDLVPHR